MASARGVFGRLALIAALAVWGGAATWQVVAGGAESAQVSAFSAAGGEFPPGWIPLTFPKIASHTQYAVVRDDDLWVVRATSQAAASGMRFAVRVDLAQQPILHWRWKVENVLRAGNAAQKSGDDYAARIYVTFEYQPEKVSWFRRAKYLTGRRIFGEIPIAAINYIWASHAKRGAIIDNAFAGDFAKMIVIESGGEHLGRWREAERNVYRDYLLAYGETPPPVNGVAIMTDTDNTGERAVAFYGDIAFRAAD